MRPIGIDLFAGAGGLSLGFEQAGFDIAAAVEIDPVHCAVHKYNFPKTAILPHSVEGLSAEVIRKAADIGDRPVDCVFGGAPCQGFSLIGHRVLDDPRNKLALEFVRIVAELKARSFVFENVKGLTVGKHKTFLKELIAAFDAAGYEVRTPWQVLNAGHFGTPQFRERLILFGARKGEALADYPAPCTNLAGRKKLIDGLPDGPSCSDALGDLPDADRFARLLASDTVDPRRYGKPSAYAAELRCMTNEAWHYGYVREWSSALLTSSARTEHTDISRRRFAETEPGSVEPISRFFKLRMTASRTPCAPAQTARAGRSPARARSTIAMRAASPSAKWRACTASPIGSDCTSPNGTGRGRSGTPCPPRLPGDRRSYRRALGIHAVPHETSMPLGDGAPLAGLCPGGRTFRGEGPAEPSRSEERGRASASRSTSSASAWAGRPRMAKKLNRYQATIEKIFFDHFEAGSTEFEFDREELEESYVALGFSRIKNIGDIPYSFRYRNALPDSVLDTQPEGLEWIIEGAGKGPIPLQAGEEDADRPREDLVVVDIPDATPELIRAYALDDEQALLAIVRYNRLIDTFLSLTTYSLQNHLRTTVKGWVRSRSTSSISGSTGAAATTSSPCRPRAAKTRSASSRPPRTFASSSRIFPACGAGRSPRSSWPTS